MLKKTNEDVFLNLCNKYNNKLFKVIDEKFNNDIGNNDSDSNKGVESISYSNLSNSNSLPEFEFDSENEEIIHNNKFKNNIYSKMILIKYIILYDIHLNIINLF